MRRFRSIPDWKCQTATISTAPTSKLSPVPSCLPFPTPTPIPGQGPHCPFLLVETSHALFHKGSSQLSSPSASSSLLYAAKRRPLGLVTAFCDISGRPCSYIRLLMEPTRLPSDSSSPLQSNRTAASCLKTCKGSFHSSKRKEITTHFLFLKTPYFQRAVTGNIAGLAHMLSTAGTRTI